MILKDVLTVLTPSEIIALIRKVPIIVFGGFQLIMRPLIATHAGCPDIDAATVLDSGSDTDSMILPV